MIFFYSSPSFLLPPLLFLLIISLHVLVAQETNTFLHTFLYIYFIELEKFLLQVAYE